MSRSECELVELKKFVKETKFYQRINFGDGIITDAKFDSEKQLEAFHFDEVDFKNKTVCDLGCNAGFFSIEAKRRGAIAVDGFDNNRVQITKAERVAEFLYQDCRFAKADINNKAFGGFFGCYDIVLMLSLFHHVKYPIQVLETLGRITREVAILEVKTKPIGNPRHLMGIPKAIKPRSEFPDPDLMKEALLNIARFDAVTMWVDTTGKSDRVVYHCRKTKEVK